MIHLLIVLCAISCVSDFINAVLARTTAVLKKLEGVDPTPPQPAFSMDGQIPNPMTMLSNLFFTKFNVFTVLRLMLGAVSIVSHLVLPYYMLSRFNKMTNANYQRQTYSYTPFMILDFDILPLPTEDVTGVSLFRPKVTTQQKPFGNLEGERLREATALTSFNRYIAFNVARTAMKAIYSTFHAIYNPEEYLQQLLNRDKAAAR
ncbi:hypothetical protein BgAZ_501960 [Babesia gibsoni]|uniref:Uncharacterized protein n=1 Tax=Babesia gibsoni TaxID=33632 RepID=A0AAD8LJA5_BABGI|nr:hypothetical protein BgAZ_501960 [Babesia gibsoni]